jgi:hypothetical protein
MEAKQIKRTRRAKPDSEAKRAVFSARITQDTRDALEAEAIRTGRSIADVAELWLDYARAMQVGKEAHYINSLSRAVVSSIERRIGYLDKLTALTTLLLELPAFIAQELRSELFKSAQQLASIQLSESGVISETDKTGSKLEQIKTETSKLLAAAEERAFERIGCELINSKKIGDYVLKASKKEPRDRVNPLLSAWVNWFEVTGGLREQVTERVLAEELNSQLEHYGQGDI